MKKVVVITGTSSGIGHAIANYYYNRRDDYWVLGISRNLTSACVHSWIEADLSQKLGIEKAVRQIKDRTDRVNTLVNNAGAMPLSEFGSKFEMNELVWLNMIAPLALSAWLSSTIANGGHVINIASVSGITGDAYTPLYSACKAGVINITKSLAKKFAPDVRVNCISPGFFDTNLVPGETPKELIDTVLLKREAQPFEIIPVIDMLERSTYMTGENIVIDGGLAL